MTTISENYLKTEQIAFPEIYLFRTGSVQSRFTSWHEDLEVLGETYTARPIKRSGFSRDTQMGKTTVDISAPVLDIMSSYVANTPIEPVTITITRLVRDDLSQLITLFVGQVFGVTFKDRTAAIRCESNSSILNVLLPKIICKPQCNHVLFDAGCGLLETSFTHISTVSNISGSSLTISGLGATGYAFSSGYIQYNSDYRMITKQTSDVIDLHIPFYSIYVGSAVSVVAGCAGSVDECENNYNNLDNFLGMLTIPQRNPTLYGA